MKANTNSGLVWNCGNAKGEKIEVANQNWIQIVEIVATGYQLDASKILAACEKEVQDAKNANADLQKTVETQKTAAEQSAAQIAFLVENVESCEKSAGNTQNAIADLQKQLQTRENIILELQKTAQDNDNANAKQIADLEEDVAACEKEVQDAQNANDNLQKTVQNKEQEIADLQKSIQESKQSNPEPESAQLTLSNARFADGRYYNSGSFNLAPNTAIDGSKLHSNR